MIFQEHYQNIDPDLGPNCLQMLSTVDKKADSNQSLKEFRNKSKYKIFMCKISFSDLLLFNQLFICNAEKNLKYSRISIIQSPWQNTFYFELSSVRMKEVSN